MVPLSTKPSTLRRIAELGNALVLAAVALCCANAWLLVRTPTPHLDFQRSDTAAPLVVLVVIDGLRPKALDGIDVPTLERYARSGGHRTVQIQSLLPSTVAGIRALVEGTIQPPTSFITDFRAPPAEHAGVLGAAKLSGMETAIAGPQLWSDLYGNWIDRSLSVFGLARDDPAVLRFAIIAVRGGANRLVVAHFSGPDVLGHQFGANSTHYRNRLVWCDQALRQIEAAAPRDAVILVTSDHGLTAGGGHAGTEPDVLHTSLYCSDPRVLAGTSAVISQTQVADLVAKAARLTVTHNPVKPRGTRLGTWSLLLVATAGCFVTVLRTSHASDVPPNAAFLLNTSVWVALAACWFSPLLGGFVALLALSYVAANSAAPSAQCRSHLLAVAGGVAFAALRLLDASVSGHDELAQPPPVWLLVGLSGLCLALPSLFRRHLCARVSSVGAGALFVCGATVIARIAGETISLSTLDVRVAFHLLGNDVPLPIAFLAAAARPFMLPLFLLAGIALAFGRRNDSSFRIQQSLNGVTAFTLGQLLFAATALPLLYLSGFISPAGYSLGLLVREIASITVLFPALAFVVFCCGSHCISAISEWKGFTSRERPATLPR